MVVSINNNNNVDPMLDTSNKHVVTLGSLLFSSPSPYSSSSYRATKML